MGSQVAPMLDGVMTEESMPEAIMGTVSYPKLSMLLWNDQSSTGLTEFRPGRFMKLGLLVDGVSTSPIGADILTWPCG